MPNKPLVRKKLGAAVVSAGIVLGGIVGVAQPASADEQDVAGPAPLLAGGKDWIPWHNYERCGAAAGANRAR